MRETRGLRYDAACNQRSPSAFAPGYIDSRDRAAAPSPRVTIERITFVCFHPWAAPSWRRAGAVSRVMDDRAKAEELFARWTRSFADIPRASGKEVVQLRDSGRKVVLIDVRSTAEMEVSVLPGAIGADEFGRRYCSSPEEYHDAVLIPYCTIGFRSGLFCRRLLAGEFGPPAPDVRNGEGVVLWSFDVGAFEGGARALHVYGSEWDVAAAGFETVRFGARGHLAGALRLIVSLLRLVRSRLARFVLAGR